MCNQSPPNLVTPNQYLFLNLSNSSLLQRERKEREMEKASEELEKLFNINVPSWQEREPEIWSCKKTSRVRPLVYLFYMPG